jgi:hypothetical protein
MLPASGIAETIKSPAAVMATGLFLCSVGIEEFAHFHHAAARTDLPNKVAVVPLESVLRDALVRRGFRHAYVPFKIKRGKLGSTGPGALALESKAVGHLISLAIDAHSGA